VRATTNPDRKAVDALAIVLVIAGPIALGGS
jgi:hypothetical protein